MLALFKEVRHRLEMRPFFAVVERSDAPNGLQRWVALAVTSSALAHAVRGGEQELRGLLEASQELLHRQLPDVIQSGSALVEALDVHQKVQELSMRMDGVIKDVTESSNAWLDVKCQLVKTGKASYEENRGALYKVDGGPNLGEELVSHLTELTPRLAAFAERLQNESVDELEAAGRAIAGHLKQRPPKLAMIGSFSSGKTTLINMLLFADAEYRGLPTKNVSNTAVVHVLRSPAEGRTEQARFRFAGSVDYRFAVNQHGYLESNPRNAELLARLVRGKVLKNAKLNIIPAENKKLRRNQVRNLKHVLRELEELGRTGQAQCDEGYIEFTAKVDHARLREKPWRDKFPEILPLESEVDWRQIQGESAQAESPESVFLLKQVDVDVKSPLLEQTTIVDTPGIGSLNDRHDANTGAYLRQAEGFILMIPTLRAEHTRVEAAIKKVHREVMRRNPRDLETALSSVAFVVNCFTDKQQMAEARKKIDIIESRICKVFRFEPDEWRARVRNPNQNNFFVVQLKHLRAGQNPQQLFDYPSIIPLRHWIARMFNRGAYRHRFTAIEKALNEDWHTTRKEVERRLREHKSHRRKQKRQVANLRILLDEAIPAEMVQQRENLERLKSDVGDAYDQAMERLDILVAESDDLKAEELDGYWDSFKASVSDLEQAVEELQNADLANALMDEVRMLVAERGLTSVLPLTSLQVPSDRAMGSHGMALNVDALDDRYAEMKARWPGWWFSRSWQKSKKLFGSEDCRTVFARNLVQYVEEAFTTLWGDYIEPDIILCRQELDRFEVDVRGRVEKALNDLEGKSEEELIAETQVKVDAFSRIAPERDDVFAELTERLTEGTNGNGC